MYNKISSIPKILFKLLIFPTVILIVLNSCSTAPKTKEVYLSDYASFIDQIQEEYQVYTVEDWETIDKKCKMFNGQWHDLFDQEFTFSDELRILKFQSQYNFLKSSSELSNYIDVKLKDQVEKFRMQIIYYVENNLEKDLEKLRQTAYEISESFGESLTMMIEEVQKKHN